MWRFLKTRKMEETTPKFEKSSRVCWKLESLEGEVLCFKETRGGLQYTIKTDENKIFVAWEKDLEKT